MADLHQKIDSPSTAFYNLFMADFNATFAPNKCLPQNGTTGEINGVLVPPGSTSIPIGCCNNPAGTTIRSAAYYRRAGLTPIVSGGVTTRGLLSSASANCCTCTNSG